MLIFSAIWGVYDQCCAHAYMNTITSQFGISGIRCSLNAWNKVNSEYLEQDDPGFPAHFINVLLTDDEALYRPCTMTHQRGADFQADFDQDGDIHNANHSWRPFIVWANNNP